MGIRVRKIVAVGHLVHKYDEIICSIHQGGHPASYHDPPVGGPWWGSFAKTTPPEGNIKRNTCYKDWVMNEMNTSPHGPFNCLDF